MPFRTLFAAACGLALIAGAGAASAQVTPYERVLPRSSDWTVDVGAGALYRSDSSGDTGSRTSLVPFAQANWRDVIYASPIDGLGYNAVAADDLRVGVQVRPRFGSEDIDGFEDLDRPDLGADVAVYAFKRLAGNVVVGGRVSRDVSGVSDGTEVYASVGVQRVTRIGLLQTTLFARGGDARLARTYYGVTPAEGAANGLPAYDPDGGVQGAGVSALLLIPVGDRWGFGGLVNYERRLGDVADSPLSRSDDGVRAGVFVARRFGG